MSKIIELTVQLHVHRVSCPGVWLCQDGFVRLTVFALGTSYQTCLLPPLFPIMFKDVFYFKKRFQQTCALNNICCLLKNESIYCELIQWTEDCVSSKYVILAQYLGTLNDVLFPPNVCASDGIDLLMRRSKHFPGILSPKIEITTKVRIDELWTHQPLPPTLHSCNCLAESFYEEPVRQTKVCHTPRYHRHRCNSIMNDWRPLPRSTSRSKSQSGSYRSCDQEIVSPRESLRCTRLATPRSSSCTRTYRRGPACIYNVQTSSQGPFLGNVKSKNMASNHTIRTSVEDHLSESSELDNDNLNEKAGKVVLESNVIGNNNYGDKVSDKYKTYYRCTDCSPPCNCEICKKYHQLFHRTSL